MSLSLGDLQKNAKLNAWYETLQERKASGQSVDVWCRENGIVRSTYYYWQKKVREALEARLSRNCQRDRRGSLRLLCIHPHRGRQSSRGWRKR